MRDCTSARSRATWEGGMRACGPGEFRASLEAQLLVMARRLSHRVVAIGFLPSRQRSLASHPHYYKFTRATRKGGRAASIKWNGGSPSERRFLIFRGHVRVDRPGRSCTDSSLAEEHPWRAKENCSSEPMVFNLVPARLLLRPLEGLRNPLENREG